MANTEDTLMREVQEELRRERMEQLWKQYGTYFLVAAIALVIAVGAYQFNHSRQQAAAKSAGAAFENADFLIEEKKVDEARKAFEELVKTAPSGYAALARLRLAGLDLEAGEKAKAIAQYESLAGDADADGLLKSFAKLQIGGLKIGEADFTEIENRLNDLTSETSPWRANARELIGLAAFKAGKLDAARKPLERILADPSSPSDVRERAQVLVAEIISAEIAKAPSAPVPKADAAPTEKPAEPAEKK